HVRFTATGGPTCCRGAVGSALPEAEPGPSAQVGPVVPRITGEPPRLGSDLVREASVTPRLCRYGRMLGKKWRDQEATTVSANSFGSRDTLRVGDESYEIFRLDAVEGAQRLPYSLKVLLENLLRTEDGVNVTADHIRALANWDPKAQPNQEIQFTPARVIMQDFTGVPCVVDLATMREAVSDLGGDPAKINPLAPAELVIDHSVIVVVFGRPDAFERNVEIEYERNRERYQFLRWGQTAFDEFKVVPPGTGIVHQANIEHLARVTMVRNGQAYPDT